MKNLEKQRLAIKRISSMNVPSEEFHSKIFFNASLVQHESNIKHFNKNQPRSQHTIGENSTLAGASRLLGQTDQDSQIINGGSCGITPTNKRKNGRLAQSQDSFSNSDSNGSEVIFVSSRDMTQKKLKQLKQVKSFQFDKLLSGKNNTPRQNQVPTTKKQIINPADHEYILLKNEQLTRKNKMLEQQNKNLLKKIAALQQLKQKPKTYRIPEFIKNREMKKNMKSTVNCSYGSMSPTKKNHIGSVVQHKTNQQKWKSIRFHDWAIQQKPDYRPQRHTLGNCRSFEQLIQKMRKQYSKINKNNQ